VFGAFGPDGGSPIERDIPSAGFAFCWHSALIQSALVPEHIAGESRMGAIAALRPWPSAFAQWRWVLLESILQASSPRQRDVRVLIGLSTRASDVDDTEEVFLPRRPSHDDRPVRLAAAASRGFSVLVFGREDRLCVRHTAVSPVL
jgi:hypothetical protein